MTFGSLRLRLLAGAAAFVLAALVLAAAGLTYLFQRHAEGWVDAELTGQLDQLIAGIDRGPDGALAVTRLPSDPRFQQPLSGRYWQVDVEPAGPVLRSRSLWDFEIALPDQAHTDDEPGTGTVAGPDRQALHLLQRRIELPARLGNREARVAVAIDNADLTASVRRFAGALVPFLLVLAALLTAAAWAQVAVGLKPLGVLRQRLADISSGRARRLGADFPEEVLPLAREVDTLLDAREREIVKARARAADLAHGLKTPLQILSDDAERLKCKGEHDIATQIENIADTMRRHVERELARVRSGANAAHVSANVMSVTRRVMRVVERTPEGKRLVWTVDVPEGLMARIDADDLTEALGNIIENAATHAATAVTVKARADNSTIVIDVIDDGSGIPPERAQEALRRGGRLDQRGSAGLGLAIVGDIAEAWGASLAIEAPERGCRIVLRIPAARYGAETDKAL
jgi:signal transduction histidine kinase